MKRFSIILILLSIPFVLSAQKYYSKSELVADMDTLYARINEIHPDMFARISREEFEKRFVHAKETMPDSLDAVGFYRIIAPLVSSLQDGHTGIYISDNDYRNSILYVLPDVEVSSARALDEALKIIAEKRSKDNVRANRRKQE